MYNKAKLFGIAFCTAAVTFGAHGALAAKADFSLDVAHVNSEQTTFHKGLEEFKRLVEERSDGRIAITLHANASLGNERDNIEGLQMGTLDAAFFSTAPVSAFVPEFDLLSAPYIFRDSKHAFSVCDGPIGQELADKLLKTQNIRTLGYMDTGMRHTYSVKPLRSFEDFKGVKIRVMESSLHMDTFKSFGALPTPMASGDVFTALSQGTIDGAENTMQYVSTMKMYEVTKNLTKSAHFYGITMLAMSERTYAKLPEDLQKIVRDAGYEAAVYQRRISDEENIEAEKKLKELGVEIIEVDLEPFRAAVRPVLEARKDTMKPELVEAIINTP